MVRWKIRNKKTGKIVDGGERGRYGPVRISTAARRQHRFLVAQSGLREGHGRKGIPIKPTILLVTALATMSLGNAHAEETYESYDAFYAARPGAVFGDPIESESGVAYSVPGKQGVHTELTAAVEKQPVRIALAADQITVNGKAFRYGSATTFPGEHPSDFAPQSANVFLARRTSAHPAVLCVQGDSSGSGESDRHKQIYLLVDPLTPKGKVTFLHLPSLLSSCRAVMEAKEGGFAFPKNSYLFDDAQESRVGLLISYFTFEHRRFVPMHNKMRLRFTQPEVPFRFAIEDKN